MEKTLVLIKPDAVERHLIGKIITAYEEKGLVIEAIELVRATKEQAAAHYMEHEGRPYYEGLIAFITSGPLVALIVSGHGAIAGVRQLHGATNPIEAVPGSIRGTFGLETGRNLVHASDSIASSERERAIWFPRVK